MKTDRERMLDMIVRREEAKAQGLDPRPEEFCGGCAELPSGFRRQVERLGQVEWLNCADRGDHDARRGPAIPER